jgi:hypothetical protein
MTLSTVYMGTTQKSLSVILLILQPAGGDVAR